MTCNNNILWIILLVLLFCNCGGGMTCQGGCDRGYDRGCGCGC